MFNYTSVLNIPAYDAYNNGLIIECKLTTISNNEFFINTAGMVATSLKRNLHRLIEIMSSMKKSWQQLASMGYLLECDSQQFIVRDSRSSSMALSIALLNLNRAIQGQPQVSGLTGTGILRIDGSFDSSHQEIKKYFAAIKNLDGLKKFITANESKNLFDLEDLINRLY